MICIRLLPALALLAVATASAGPTNSELSLSIVVPGLYPNAERTILQDDRNSHFHVILANISKKTQGIITDGNSWGDEALTFEITDKAGKKSTARKMSDQYQKNIPHWWVLQPQESVVIDVFFADQQKWEGFPHPARHGQSETVTMRAIFQFPGGDKSLSGNDRWTGCVSSEPEQFVFYNRMSENAAIETHAYFADQSFWQKMADERQAIESTNKPQSNIGIHTGGGDASPRLTAAFLHLAASAGEPSASNLTVTVVDRLNKILVRGTADECAAAKRAINHFSTTPCRDELMPAK